MFLVLGMKCSMVWILFYVGAILFMYLWQKAENAVFQKLIFYYEM